MTSSPMTRFLQRIAEVSPAPNVHQYILRKGRLFHSQPLTQDEQRYIDRCDWKRHQAKQCWKNAQLTALTMPAQEGMTLLYAEGFVSLGWEHGMEHAWLSLNGKVVDTTIRPKGTRNPGKEDPRIMGVIPKKWEYYGVEFRPESCGHILEHDLMGPLIDDWQCRWPLLSTEPEANAP